MERLKKFFYKAVIFIIAVESIPFLMANTARLFFTETKYLFLLNICRFAFLSLFLIYAVVKHEKNKRKENPESLKSIYWFLIYLIVSFLIWTYKIKLN